MTRCSLSLSFVLATCALKYVTLITPIWLDSTHMDDDPRSRLDGRSPGQTCLATTSAHAKVLQLSSCLLLDEDDESIFVCLHEMDQTYVMANNFQDPTSL